MKTLPFLLIVLWAGTASAANVINVEFKFTPFTGDPAKEDKVQTVAGKATVFVNNVPITDQDIQEQELPVLFDDREIAPSVWIPTESLGPALRKGKNTIRIEFTPASLKQKYRAQLRWALVMDEVSETKTDGGGASTNQAGEGVDDKTITGKLVMEHPFEADFAKDQPWHHYAAIKTLTDADRAALKQLVSDRVAAFKPDFSLLYEMLDKSATVDGGEIRKNKCLEKGYAAGIRIVGAPEPQVEILTTGGPEVVIRAKEGGLFAPKDPSAFEKVKGEENQNCVNAALMTLYPQRLVVVRNSSGAWDVVY